MHREFTKEVYYVVAMHKGERVVVGTANGCYPYKTRKAAERVANRWAKDDPNNWYYRARVGVYRLIGEDVG